MQARAVGRAVNLSNGCIGRGKREDREHAAEDESETLGTGQELRQVAAVLQKPWTH